MKHARCLILTFSLCHLLAGCAIATKAVTSRKSAVTATATYQPTIAQWQSRAIAHVIMGRDVKLWHENNAPDWTLRRAFGDDFPFPLPGPPDMKLLDYTIETLRAWQNISTSAVVTTRRSYIDRVYQRIKRDVPNLLIIPGLKLNEYLPAGYDTDFMTDRSVWEAFASDALRCAELTGTRQIVIMAEGPMRRFYQGNYAPNVADFQDALAPLRDSGLRIIWYPFGPHAGRPISHGTHLVRGILDAVPNSWFPSVGDGFPVRENDPDQNARRIAHIDATNRRIVHHLFVAPGDGDYIWSNGRSKQAYTLPEFMRWIRSRAIGDVWIPPGSFNARALGVEMEAFLLPRAFKVAPASIPGNRGSLN